MLLNYFEQIEGYKVYITSANIKGLSSIPYNAVKEEDYPLITEKENHLRVFTNKWEYLPNHVDTKFYHKSTKEEKKYEMGETPDLDSYTEVIPLENERFQKFENNKWVIDEEAKIQNEKDILINKAKYLLASTDWTQTLDNLNNRGQEWVDKWAIYRVELRKVVNGERDTLPEEIV